MNKNLKPFCPACQAIPAAGYCNLAGCPTDPVVDLMTIENWLGCLPDLEMDDIAADGGVTVAMVVQQEAREMAGRMKRAIAVLRKSAG